MSSFKDTFTRDQGGESNLQYDDTAFYFFFLTILSIIAIPLFFSLLWQILFPPGQTSTCPCSDCQTKLKSLKSSQKFNFLTKSFVFKVNYYKNLHLFY